MNRQQILERLRELALPDGEYWLITGAAMVLYGMKDETHDIDMGCTPALAHRLAAEGHPVSRMGDGTRRIVLGSDAELFEGWLYDRVERLEGIPIVSVPGLIAMKRALGRDKDRADLARIERWLQARDGQSEPL